MPLEGWPTQHGVARAQRILDAVRSGDFEHRWCPITLSDGAGTTLTIEVSCDALKIDGVRANVDAATQQQIADLIGGMLLTPKIGDEIYKRAKKLTPSPQPISSSTAAMIAHSARVDALVGGATGLVADPGKDWVLVKAIFTQSAIAKNRAANMGWRRVNQPPIQGVGTVHNAGTSPGTGHSDYSEIARFVRRQARLGERVVDLGLVYTGREAGTSLVSHEGPLPGDRQPGLGAAPVLPPLQTAGPSTTAGLAAPVGLGAAGAALGYAAAGATGGWWGAAVGFVVGIVVRRAS